MSAAGWEEAFERAVKAGRAAQITLPSKVFNGCDVLSFEREGGLLICRGGEGYSAEDQHYIRTDCVQAITIKVPAAVPAIDRVPAGFRDELRQAVGFPLRVAARPGVLENNPGAFSEWLTAIHAAIAAVCAIDAKRNAFLASIDQVLLREGEHPALLGGSTLILEAGRESGPAAEQIRVAIEAIV